MERKASAQRPVVTTATVNLPSPTRYGDTMLMAGARTRRERETERAGVSNTELLEDADAHNANRDGPQHGQGGGGRAVQNNTRYTAS